VFFLDPGRVGQGVCFSPAFIAGRAQTFDLGLSFCPRFMAETRVKEGWLNSKSTTYFLLFGEFSSSAHLAHILTFLLDVYRLSESVSLGIP
jgi:hypothetical protein